MMYCHQSILQVTMIMAFLLEHQQVHGVNKLMRVKKLKNFLISYQRNVMNNEIKEMYHYGG